MPEGAREDSRTRTHTGTLIKHAGISGFWNLVSRVSGLLRDMVVAAVFPKAITDAFYIAYAIPNVFRRLLGEGGLTPAIVMVFTSYRQKGEDEARSFYRHTLFAMFVAGALISVLGMVLARPLVTLFAAGFDDQKFELAVSLTRILFPYLLLVSLMAFAMGILNTLGHYAAPSAGPVLLNLSMIAGALTAMLVSKSSIVSPIYVLAISVLIGGVLQLLINVPPLVKRGYAPRPEMGTHPGIRETMSRLVPALAGIGIYQVNVLLSRLFASYLDDGSVSAIYYSQRIFELPMALFVASMMVAVMPKLSKSSVERNVSEYEDRLSRALHLSLFFTIPATVALLVYGLPTISVIYWRGRFDASMATFSTQTLWGFMAGMLPATVARILISAYQGADDFKTPAVHGALTSLVFMALFAFPLMHLFGIGGLALAVSIGTLAQSVFLGWRMRHRLGVTLRWRMGSIARMVLASLAMGAAVAPFTLLVDWTRAGASPLKMVVYAGGVLVGGGVYLLMAHLLAIEELRDILDMFGSRFIKR